MLCIEILPRGDPEYEFPRSKHSSVEAEEPSAKRVEDEQEESASREEVGRASSEDAVKEEQQTGGALPDDKSGKGDKAG